MNHEVYMQRCIQLAKKGIGHVAPNPLVGSVIVCEGKIIGEGYHQMYGEAHAEVNAIKSVKDKSLLSKSILYVNLEPCAHFGKTPPCANLIIEYKIPQVIIGCIDSFAKVAGKGVNMLKTNGVDVTVGVSEKESLDLNKRFFVFHKNKRPFVILKWAQTQDGFIAPDANLHESKRWITNKRTQALVHTWRSEESAILVGKNTVLKDNPSLTVREIEGNNPIRVVLDKNLELYGEKEKYKIFNSDSQTIIFNQEKDFVTDNLIGIKIDFKHDAEQQILTKLYELNIQSLIIEGGAKVLESFLTKQLFDEVRILQSKNIFGSGIKAPNWQGELKQRINSFGDEILIF